MDWDGDGRLDMIVGDRLGNVYFFRRLPYGDINLEQGPMVAVGERPISVGLNSSPAVVSWNGDSLPDLVVGRLEGLPAGLLLFINGGAPGQPQFSATDTVMCAGEPVQLYAAYPDFGDLSGDGLEDLIVGNTTGRIPCFINSGTAEAPEFLDFEELRADGGVIDFYTYVRPSICNWDQDSIPDLLVATCDGTIHLFLGTPGTGVEQPRAAGIHGMTLVGHVNPARGTFEPVIALTVSAKVLTSIFSTDGRLLISEDSGTLGRGTHRLMLDVGHLPEGVYIFTCEDGKDGVSGRFTVLGR